MDFSCFSFPFDEGKNWGEMPRDMQTNELRKQISIFFLFFFFAHWPRRQGKEEVEEERKEEVT